jgi:hypothetical protein
MNISNNDLRKYIKEVLILISLHRGFDGILFISEISYFISKF